MKLSSLVLAATLILPAVAVDYPASLGPLPVGCPAKELAFSRDGSIMAVACGFWETDGFGRPVPGTTQSSVELFDSQTGAFIKQIASVTNKKWNSLGFSPSSTKNELVVCSATGDFAVYNVDDDSLVASARPHTGGAQAGASTQCKYSAEDEVIVAGQRSDSNTNSGYRIWLSVHSSVTGSKLREKSTTQEYISSMTLRGGIVAVGLSGRFGKTTALYYIATFSGYPKDNTVLGNDGNDVAMCGSTGKELLLTSSTQAYHKDFKTCDTTFGCGSTSAPNGNTYMEIVKSVASPMSIRSVACSRRSRMQYAVGGLEGAGAPGFVSVMTGKVIPGDYIGAPTKGGYIEDRFTGLPTDANAFDLRFSGDDRVLAALVFDGNYSIYAWMSTTSNPTAPTGTPTPRPTRRPTFSKAPTPYPTAWPTTAWPTPSPTTSPTSGSPTKAPTEGPTANPTTGNPTNAPTEGPTGGPTDSPTTNAPTEGPTGGPTDSPTTGNPTTAQATDAPSTAPTPATDAPSVSPTEATDAPSMAPTEVGSTSNPSQNPSQKPSSSPTGSPTVRSAAPTASPSDASSAAPTGNPTAGENANVLSPAARGHAGFWSLLCGVALAMALFRC